jgi:prepilin-type N-terminal cleavage/methylation domain-containing protein
MTLRGFTVVELIITITVMGILMTLAVVSINSTQVRARDEERKTDIATIATALETYYTSGSDTQPGRGVYPTTALATSEATIRASLRDVNMESFIAPGQTSVTDSFKAATSASSLLSPAVGEYIYQPLTSTNGLCSFGDCRRFVLYYRLESNDTVQRLVSKGQ